MDIINCARCGKIFKRVLRNVCKDCLEIEKREMTLINQYISESSDEDISLEEISERFEIPQEVLNRYIKEGYFADTADKLVRACNMCGAPIKSLNSKTLICQKCKKNLDGVVEELSPAKSDRGFKRGKSKPKTEEKSKDLGFMRDYE